MMYPNSRMCMSLPHKGTIQKGAQKIGPPYFYVQEGVEKCFSEEARRRITITVSYNNYENPGVECSVTIKDHKKKPLISKEVNQGKLQGKLAYMVKEDGEHHICVFCAHSPWFSVSSRKWSLSVDIGDYQLNTTDLSKSHELTTAEEIVKSIGWKLESIRSENDYQRKQEGEYRKIYAKVNSYIIKFAIFEILVMIIVTVFAIVHLSRYFHAQKLY